MTLTKKDVISQKEKHTFNLSFVSYTEPTLHCGTNAKRKKRKEKHCRGEQ
jgi:hypothetical protein